MTDTFPSFRYGPDGAAQVFQCAADVPAGWVDHPSKLKGGDPSAEVKGAAKFDHDGDGKVGGSKPKAKRKPAKRKAVKRNVARK